MILTDPTLPHQIKLVFESGHGQRVRVHCNCGQLDEDGSDTTKAKDHYADHLATLRGTLIAVTVNPYPGSFEEQPSPGEAIIDCPICGIETDAVFDDIYPDSLIDMTCLNGEPHEILVPIQ